ncbi:MAG: hypothetical protein VX075_10955, partial [Pseudomonadota bacterium]|nr:hypothetical protein [Pseudomonadota bacterium]
MRAAVLRAFGDLSNAVVGEFPDPVPGPDEILLRVEAVAANFVDIFWVSNYWMDCKRRMWYTQKVRSFTKLSF